MKIYEVRCYPGRNYRTVSMILDDKLYHYSNNGPGTETIEIYFLKNGNVSEGHYYSSGYLLWQHERLPQKYAAQLAFLREEHNKINWEALEVRNALTGEHSQYFT